MGPDPCQYFKSSPRGYQCVIRLKNHWTKVKQKFHYPSLDLSFPQEFGSLLKGGGREDYFQNMRRKLEKINPAHLRIHRHTHRDTRTNRYTQIQRHIYTHTNTWTNRYSQTHKHTQTQTQTYTDTHRYKHTDPRDTHRHTYTQTYTQTHRQTCTHRHIQRYIHSTHTSKLYSSPCHFPSSESFEFNLSEHPFAIRQLSSQHYQWDFRRKTNMGVHLPYFLMCLALPLKPLWQNLGDGSLQGPQCNQQRSLMEDKVSWIAVSHCICICFCPLK